MEIKFDDIGNKILDILNNTNNNIFITWKAWTWKSTLLKYFLKNTKKNAVVLAPTWVAALNIWWQTIHSFFWFSTSITSSRAKELWYNTKKHELYKKINTIIIDEVSMVRADLMDCVDQFMQAVLKNNMPFWWVQMVFVWDLFQLPPVITYSEKEIFNRLYKSPYFFSCDIFKSSFWDMDLIELEKIHRQSNDSFINILNKIRTKTAEQEDLNLLNKQVTNPSEIKIDNWILYLCWTNDKAAKINDDKLESIENIEFDYYAEVSGDFNDKDFPTNDVLTLKKWAQVMFVSNDPLGRWKNWSLWEVIELNEDIVSVKLFDNDEIYEVAPYKWEVTKYVFDKEEHKIKSEPVWYFSQLPLKLAWAITIHKAQWKTFNNVIIDFERWIFAHGQAYVALSRCTSLEWIRLLSPLRLNQIIIDPIIIDFFNNFEVSKKNKQKWLF